jgi:hypothetical protein
MNDWDFAGLFVFVLAISAVIVFLCIMFLNKASEKNAKSIRDKKDAIKKQKEEKDIAQYDKVKSFMNEIVMEKAHTYHSGKEYVITLFMVKADNKKHIPEHMIDDGYIYFVAVNGYIRDSFGRKEYDLENNDWSSFCVSKEIAFLYYNNFNHCMNILNALNGCGGYGIEIRKNAVGYLRLHWEFLFDE